MIEKVLLSGALSLVMLAGCSPDAPSCDGGAECKEEPKSTFLDSRCSLTGALSIELGEGDAPSTFNALVPGVEPTLHHGPQGGQHLLLGVRVADPATEFARLQVEFLVQVHSTSCDPTQTDCAPLIDVGYYRGIVDSKSPLFALSSDGGLVASGFIVIVTQWPLNRERSIQVNVLDPCSRKGHAEVDLPAQPPS